MIVFRMLSSIARWTHDRKREREFLPSKLTVRFSYWVGEDPMRFNLIAKVVAWITTLLTIAVIFCLLTLPFRFLGILEGSDAFWLSLAIIPLSYIWFRYTAVGYLAQASRDNLKATVMTDDLLRKQILSPLWMRYWSATAALWRQGISPKDFKVLLSLGNTEQIIEVFGGPSSALYK